MFVNFKISATEKIQNIVSVPLQKGCLMIGREDCSINLKDPSVSKVHALVTAASGLVLITDMASRTGVRVNKKIRTSALLKAGDVIQLGNVKLEFLSFTSSGETLRRSPTTRRELR